MDQSSNLSPHISVVIPAYNCEDTIGEALNSLLTQDYKKSYEIIVVDDGSTDKTSLAVLGFIKNDKQVNVKFVTQPHRGPAAARNLGIQHAKGELVLFMDADCVANREWISVMTTFTNEKIAGVGGTYRTLNPEKKVSRYVGYEIDFRHLKMGRRVDFLGTYSVAFRKNVLMEIGGFDETFVSANAEDNDLSYRIIDRGYDLLYEPKGWVWHRHVSTFRGYSKQQFNRARWRVKLYRKHPKQVKGDKYVGLSTFIQPLLWALMLPIIITSFFKLGPNVSIASLVATLLVLCALNIRFTIWILKKGESFIFSFFSLALSVTRSLVWLLGALYGLLIWIGQSFYDVGQSKSA